LKDNIFVPYGIPPEIIGGISKLAQKLEYPEIASKAGVEGQVIINVLVSTTGQVLETKVMKLLGNNGCDETAIKVIKMVQ